MSHAHAERMDAQKSTRPSRTGTNAAYLFLFVFLASVMVAPTAVAEAPTISEQKLIYHTTNGAGRAPSTVYDPVEDKAWVCDWAKNSGGSTHQNYRHSSTDDWATKSGGGISGTGGSGGHSCGKGANNTVASVWLNPANSNQCQFETVAGDVVSRTFTGTGEIPCYHSAVPLYFGPNDYGLIGYDGSFSWNGTAQTKEVDHGAYWCVAEGEYDATAATYYALQACTDGSLYRWVVTSAIGMTRTLVASNSTVVGTPGVAYDGTTFTTCYVTNDGQLLYASGTDFTGLTYQQVANNATAVFGCETVAGSTSLFHHKWLFYDNGVGGWDALDYRQVDPACGNEQTPRNVDAYIKDGLIYAMHTDCASPSTVGGLWLTVFGGDIGGIPTPGGGAGSPITEAKEFFDTSWGFDPDATNWLFALAIVAMVTFAFAKVSASPFVAMLGGLLGCGIALAFGFLPVWFMLLLVFVIVAMVGSRLFGSGASED